MKLLTLNNKFFISTINICVRLINIGSKFFLIMFLLKNLNLEEYGRYSVIASTVSFGVYIIGLDFYTYYSRQLVNLPYEKWQKYLNTTFFSYLFIYLIFVIILKFLFYFKIIDSNYLFITCLLLFFEFYSQELYRILIILNKSVIANLTVFVRNTLWILPYVILSNYIFRYNQLLLLLYLWLIGSILSIITAIYFINLKLRLFKIYQFENLKYFFNGLSVSIFFFLSTLSLRAIIFFDKIILKYFADDKVIGVYSFFSNIMNITQTIIDVSIVSIYLPFILVDNKLIKSKSLKEFSFRVLIINIVITLILYFSFELIISLTHQKSIFILYPTVYNWILFASFTLNLSSIPHYYLYANNQDSKVVIATLFSLSLFIVSSYFLTKYFQLLGLSISIFICYCSLFFTKSWYVYIYVTRSTFTKQVF